MSTFQVSSRSVQVDVKPKKKPRRLRLEWLAIIRFVFSVGAAGGLFALLTVFTGSHNTIFILLPVLVYLAATQVQRYSLKLPFFALNIVLHSTPVYLLLTICLAFVYYGAITGVELLIHQGEVSHIILITTALTWTIMLDPVRVYFQKRIERRFNVRNREADKAIEAFTATLRKEIDLDQLRERFLTVIQRTMQPYFTSLWICTVGAEPEQAGSTEEISIADDDPLIPYMLSHPGALGIDRLHLDSPVLQEHSLRAAEMILPLAGQGELTGLLVLGPHLEGEPYTPDERALLATLAPSGCTGPAGCANGA